MLPKLEALLLYFLLLFLPISAFAQSTYYAVRSGNWADAGDPIWAATPGGAPTLNNPNDATATVVIQPGITVELNVSGSEMGSLTVAAGGTLTRTGSPVHYVDLHGPEILVDGTITGNVGLDPRSGAITVHSNGAGSATFARIRKGEGGACQLTIDMDVTVDYSGGFAAITNQSGGVTATGPLDIIVNAGRTLTITQGDVSIDGVDGTNNNESDGSLEIFGTLDIQDGDLYLTSDNDSGNDLEYRVAAGGLLRVNGTLIGNDVADMSAGAGAQVYFELETGGELSLRGAGAGWQSLSSRNQLTLQPGSRISYLGFSDQTVFAELDYQDLHIANPSVRLAAPTAVAGELSFGSGGRLAIGDHDLEINGTLTGNEDGFIVTDGAGLLRIGLPEFTDFVLPIGPSVAEYTPCTLYRNPNGLRDRPATGAKTAPALLGVAVSSIVPTNSTPAASLVGKRWTVTLFSGDGAGFSITPGWTAFDQQSSFDPASCYVSWRAGATAEWVGDTPAAATLSNGYYQRTRGPLMLTAGNEHAFIPASNGALPVTLLSFTAFAESTTVVLDWVTAAERDNDYFVIERSPDGREFRPVGKVAGQGTSELESHYTFTDRDPLPGRSYYRLRQVDFDGTSEYFGPLAVDFGGAGAELVRVFPNPVLDQVTLQAHFVTPATASLLTATGTRIRSWAIPADSSRHDLSLAELPPGIYLLRVATARTEYSTRLVKQ